MTDQLGITHGERAVIAKNTDYILGLAMRRLLRAVTRR